MSRVHLLLADVPRILGDIIAMLAEDPRLEIVAHVSMGSDLDQAVRRTGADVVLMSERMKHAAAWPDLLRRHPGLRLLWLSTAGDQIRLCDPVSNEMVIRDVSAQDLVRAILGEYSEDP